MKAIHEVHGHEPLLRDPSGTEADDADLGSHGRGDILHPRHLFQNGLDLFRGRLGRGQGGVGFSLKGDLDDPRVHGRHQVPSGKGYLLHADHEEDDDGEDKEDFVPQGRMDQAGEKIPDRVHHETSEERRDPFQPGLLG